VQSATSRARLDAAGSREYARRWRWARRELRMSPDRWMSPRATRRRALRGWT